MDIKQQNNNNNNNKMFSNSPITKISSYQQNNLTTTDSILRAKIKYNKAGFLPNIYEHVTQIQNNNTSVSTATSNGIMPLTATQTINTNTNANRNSMYFYNSPMSNPSNAQSDLAINANGHRKLSNTKDVSGSNSLTSHQDKQINESSRHHHSETVKTSDYSSNASSSASSSSSNEIEEEENLIETLIRGHNTYQLNENFKKLIKPYSYYLNDSIFKSVVYSRTSGTGGAGVDYIDTNYDSDTSTESFSRYAPTDDEDDDKE